MLIMGSPRISFSISARGPAAILLALFVVSRLVALESAQAWAGEGVAIIDTHVHMIRSLKRGSPDAPAALRIMDAFRVEMAIILPPPFPGGHPGIYGRRELEPIAREYPGRFAFVAGGETLNPIVHRTAPEAVTPDIIREFRREAEIIVNAGAAGFGELTAEHFSSGRGNHPYESTRPDHPLFLVLADIAARHGMPIDLHMEAVPRDMPTPERYARGANPNSLKENISAFERLLAHNRDARIVWAHAGWDLTGERTVPLMRAMLSRHPNLYMSVKLDSRGPQLTSALDPNGTIRSGWLALLKDFPDRFLIGSDQFYDDGTERLARVRKFVDQLPADVANLVGRENARRVYRLGKPAK